MAEWWNSMTGLEQFFILVAIPSTLLLIVQTILTLLGLGEQDADTDVETDGDVSEDFEPAHDPGLRLFTLRGLVAFFCIFGWTGLVCLQGQLGLPVTLPLAAIAGLAAMLIVALLLRGTLKLQSDGTVKLTNAIGKSASVYIRIPAGRTEHGKVNVMVQDSFIEADAVTDEDADLTPGHQVTVVGLANPNTLLVTSKK